MPCGSECTGVIKAEDYNVWLYDFYGRVYYLRYTQTFD